jgi:hypothetical protein
MELIKLLYEGIEKHGFWFFVQIILLLCVAASITIAFLYLQKKIEKDKKEGNNVVVTVNVEHEHEQETLPGLSVNHPDHNWRQLLCHSFFRSVQKMINYEIQHIEIKERLRRAIFRDFLLIIFTVYHDKIRSFVISGNMDQMSSELFHNKLHSLVTEIINEYERLAIREKIPDIVISKYNKWHQDKTEIIYRFVDDVCEADDWYVSNSVKFYSFLNQMTSILDLTLIDARKTLVHLNGELDKIEYKNITSEKVKHHNESGTHPVFGGSHAK